MKVGDVVRDTITGFEGTAIARTEWLNGCVRFIVQSPTLHEGKPIEAQHFDEEQLELVEEKGIAMLARATGAPGGDRPDPKRAPDPRR